MRWFHFHGRYRSQLSAYLDDQLSRAQRQELERHLDLCQACRGELEELKAIAHALHRLPEHEAPRSFALAPELVRQPRSWSPLLAAGMRLATAGLAVALAAVLIVDLGDIGGGKPTTPEAQEGPAAMRPAAREEEEAGLLEAAGGPAAAGIPSPTPDTGAATAPPPTAQERVPERAEDTGEAPSTGEEASRPPPQETPAASVEMAPSVEEGEGLDPLRAAEIALGVSLGVSVVGMAALAAASRRG